MTTPIYDPNVPQFLFETFADSQGQLQINFQTLFDAWLKNHTSLEVMDGDHTTVRFVQQPNDIQTDPSEITFYTKVDDQTTTQLFYRYQGNGQIIQVSNYQIYSISQVGVRTQYFTMLPGNIFCYFGVFRATTSPQNQILTLFPPIAKNIITVSMCNQGTPTLKPVVDPNKKNPQGYIDQITLSGGQSFSDATRFYFVMVNI